MRTRLFTTAAALAFLLATVISTPATVNAVQGANTNWTPIIFRAGLVTSGQIVGTGNSQPQVIVPITPTQITAGQAFTIYSDARCTVAVGSGTLGAAGSATNITVTVSPPSTTEFLFYQATPGFGCALLDSVPGAPSVQGTNPPTSPGQPSPNFSPSVYGFGLSNSTVQIFTDPGCTQLVGQGNTNPDNSYLIGVNPLPANATITLYARQIDSKGDASPCSSAVTTGGGSFQYFTSGAASTLYITGSSPASPSTTNQPQINGAGGSGAGGNYLLFLDAACTNQLNPQPQSVNNGDGSFYFIFAVAGGPVLPVGDTTMWVGQPQLATCSGFGAQPNGFTYTVLSNNPPTSAPTLSGSSGQGAAPTFQVTGAAALSIVYLYANGCDPNSIDDQTTYADGNGNATVQPVNPVTGAMTFYAQYQTAVGFSPCSQGLFYSP